MTPEKWQPIATAPDDQFLIVVGPGREVSVAWLAKQCFRGPHWHAAWYAADWDDRCENSIVHPTHWMPLPDPPSHEETPE
jgi:hypothetical protein